LNGFLLVGRIIERGVSKVRLGFLIFRLGNSWEFHFKIEQFSQKFTFKIKVKNIEKSQSKQLFKIPLQTLIKIVEFSNPFKQVKTNPPNKSQTTFLNTHENNQPNRKTFKYSLTLNFIKMRWEKLFFGIRKNRLNILPLFESFEKFDFRGCWWME
jgi:hypothetical protein